MELPYVPKCMKFKVSHSKGVIQCTNADKFGRAEHHLQLYCPSWTKLISSHAVKRCVIRDTKILNFGCIAVLLGFPFILIDCKELTLVQ